MQRKMGNRLRWGVLALLAGAAVSQACSSTHDLQSADAAPEGPSGSTCVATPGTSTPAGSPATGAIVGPELSGDICSGGTVAYLERVQTGLLMIINGSFTPGDVLFASPANATVGGAVIHVGVSAAVPGTYASSDGACGAVSFCVSLPVPASVDCGNATSNCPAGCSVQGSALAPTCMPDMPEICYDANGASDCLSVQPARGSWTLNLTSVEPYTGTEASAADGRFVTHGTFVSTMSNDADSSAGPATLSLAF